MWVLIPFSICGSCSSLYNFWELLGCPMISNTISGNIGGVCIWEGIYAIKAWAVPLPFSHFILSFFLFLLWLENLRCSKNRESKTQFNFSLKRREKRKSAWFVFIFLFSHCSLSLSLFSQNLTISVFIPCLVSLILYNYIHENNSCFCVILFYVLFCTCRLILKFVFKNGCHVSNC